MEVMNKSLRNEIINECQWCEINEPEWSIDARCWIHRLDKRDRKCTVKFEDPLITHLRKGSTEDITT